MAPPKILWSVNNDHLTWLLLTELEKPENVFEFVGKQDKNQVYFSYYSLQYL